MFWRIAGWLLGWNDGYDLMDLDSPAPRVIGVAWDCVGNGRSSLVGIRGRQIARASRRPSWRMFA